MMKPAPKRENTELIRSTNTNVLSCSAVKAIVVVELHSAVEDPGLPNEQAGFPNGFIRVRTARPMGQDG